MLSSIHVRPISRRRFLGTMLGAGAAAALLPRRLCWAAAAQPVFPTIFIQLRGGWDPAQHFCARTGLVNRACTDSTIAKTSSGIYWFRTILSDMAPHM